MENSGSTIEVIIQAMLGFARGISAMLGGLFVLYGLYIIFCSVRDGRTNQWQRALVSIVIGAVLLIVRLTILA